MNMISSTTMEMRTQKPQHGEMRVPHPMFRDSFCHDGGQRKMLQIDGDAQCNGNEKESGNQETVGQHGLMIFHLDLYVP